MCLSAIYWSRIDTVYYANTKADAGDIGFDDQFIYEELEKPKAARSIPVVQLMRNEAQQAFKLWSQSAMRHRLLILKKIVRQVINLAPVTLGRSTCSAVAL